MIHRLVDKRGKGVSLPPLCTLTHSSPWSRITHHFFPNLPFCWWANLICISPFIWLDSEWWMENNCRAFCIANPLVILASNRPGGYLLVLRLIHKSELVVRESLFWISWGLRTRSIDCPRTVIEYLFTGELVNDQHCPGKCRGEGSEGRDVEGDMKNVVLMHVKMCVWNSTINISGANLYIGIEKHLKYSHWDCP